MIIQGLTPAILITCFPNNIKNKIEDLLEEKINVFYQNKSKVLDKNKYKFNLLYVNHVIIKYFEDKSFSQNSELNNNFFNSNGAFVMHEQKFRINSLTSFDELKIIACEFWGNTDFDQFKFYDEKLNDIFIENQAQIRNFEELTVNDFFEKQQFTNAILILK